VQSLAVTEFVVFVTGMRAPAGQLIYRGETPVVHSSRIPNTRTSARSASSSSTGLYPAQPALVMGQVER